jgi:chitodextrinase
MTAFTTTGATSHTTTISNFTNGSSNTYYVKCQDTAGNTSGNASVTFSVAAPPDTTPPSTPTNLSASAISSSQINLTWSASTDNVGVTGYKVFRNGTQISTTTTNSYSDAGLTASTQYSYTVAAYDAAANVSSQSSGATATTQAQQSGGGGSTGILPADRLASANWANAGMASKGGIPNRTTVCGATVTPLGGGQDDSARIQAAIDACPLGQVVMLSAGTFNFTNGHYLLINKGITLRGAGAGQTILAKTDGAHLEPGAATGPNPAPLIILGPVRYGMWPGNPDGSTNSVNLTADGQQGSNSITVASAASFRVGHIVLLDEASGAGWQPDVTGGVNGVAATSVWASPDYRVVWRKHNPAIQYVDDFAANQFPYQPQTNGDQYSRLDRVTNEIKEITSISGNTITFSSPLTISYRVSHTAQLTWYSDSGSGAYIPHVQGAGIENLSVSGGDDGNIKFEYCAYCWGKGIESSIWTGQGIEFIGAFRNELRDFYSHDSSYASPGGGSYAIALDDASSEVLIENGISVRADKVMVARAAGAGSVIAYNYTDMGFIDYSPGWIEIGLNASHFVGSHHVLFEGNYAVNADSDDTHGASIYMTFFRNWLRGIRAPLVNPKNAQTIDDASQLANGPRRAAGPMSYSYWFSFIGNVMGASGQMSGWTYEGTWGSGTPAIWMLGWGDSNPDPQEVSASFPGHIIRDGNWDWLQSKQSWHTTPGGFTTPASMYLSAKPAEFATCQWPWVDPTTGTTYTLPAKARYDAGAPFGTVCGYSIDGSGSGDTQPPTVPTNLAASTVSNSQINLTWTVSTDNVGVTGYKIYRNGTQVGTSATNSYSDTGLPASTQYTYTVSAYDAAGNNSAQSSSASATTQAGAADTTPPVITVTAPTGQLAANTTSMTLSVITNENATCAYATAAGQTFASMTTFSTTGGTAHSATLSGLTNGTSYTYYVKCKDTAGNISTDTPVPFSVASGGGGGGTTISFAQQSYATPQSNQTTVTTAYTGTQTAGDMNIVAIGWNDTTSNITSVTDSQGNAYQLAVPVFRGNGLSQAIYYAPSIKAGADTVSATFNQAAIYVDLRVAEYAGVSAFDTGTSATGNDSTPSTGAITTAASKELLFGAGMTFSGFTAAGAGFTTRVITSPDSDILEDQMVNATGSYSAGASVSPSSFWLMQIAAFK